MKKKENKRKNSSGEGKRQKKKKGVIRVAVQQFVHFSFIFFFFFHSRPNRFRPPPFLAAPHAPLNDSRRTRHIKPRTSRIKARASQIQMRRRLYRRRAICRRCRRRRIMVWRVRRCGSSLGLSSSMQWGRGRRGARGRTGGQAVRFSFRLRIVHLVRICIQVVRLSINVHLRATHMPDFYMRASTREEWCRGRRWRWGGCEEDVGALAHTYA